MIEMYKIPKRAKIHPPFAFVVKQPNLLEISPFGKGARGNFYG
jgi:hypothetical protein